MLGRRDASLLLFAGAALSFERISRLRRSTVGTDWEGGVSVEGHRIDAGWLGEAGADVYRRWTAVLDFSACNPGTRMLAAAFRNDSTAAQLLSPVDAVSSHVDRPVFTGVTRCG